MTNEDTTLKQPPKPQLGIAEVSTCPSINFFNVDCI